MKKTKFIFISLITLLLGACSGSDTYRGEWKATDGNNDRFQIVFGEHNLSILKDGVEENFEYSQYSINIENSIETYGINLDNGRQLQIHFPIGNDESRGAILDANDLLLYIISRNGYLGYEDVYGI